ncbi:MULTISPECIES: hypothetical protein [unclassified Streptomyces]|uniref:hypothetical protein n=1 Tax=unclassified Streptomyces TaxID=2593676 RepID=UPI001BE71252|nr:MULTISPECIES: hypothetical protein [unclassified Streptomyces]MBT2407147.1 hypothetical protein [Streptomyces sp. ISL-21]MBT2457792.1 hypothetical protein [Streptomyces sp. ISL-86]MBT2612795.1 hypothetical protein [Streptomyces sp. ISL-87]
MKPMPYVVGAALVTLLALPAPPPARAAAAAPAATHHHTSDEIARFLADFYGDHGPTRHDREHRTSQQLKDKQQNADFDVLLCAQNTPQDIGIGTVTVAQSAGVGWATVTTHWDADSAEPRTEARTNTFTAYVRLDSRPIRLDDVICAG